MDNQQKHKDLVDKMNRAREWMSSRLRTMEEREKWYPAYKELVKEIDELEEKLWGPIPW